MTSLAALNAYSSRPYRSKRHRPCDVCRQRKSACRIDLQPPCAICRQLRVECTFNRPPAKRRNTGLDVSPPGMPPSIAGSQPEVAVMEDDEDEDDDHERENEHEHEHGHGHEQGLELEQDQQVVDVGGSGGTPEMLVDPLLNHMDLSPPVLQHHHLQPHQQHQQHQQQQPHHNLNHHNTMEPVLQEDESILLPHLNWNGESFDLDPGDYDRLLPDAERPTPPAAMPVRPLDQLQGFSAQYFGLSGESDPYLLRHFRFPSEGQRRFFKVHFRQVAADSLDGSSIPTHFMISANELGNAIKPETSNPRDPADVRKELDEMVHPHDGRRLVALFVQFVFPNFPVISRSQLGISAQSRLPEIETLSQVPPHLLAAIYAMSIQFCHHDNVLCVSNVYTKPPTDRLWRIVLDEIMQEIHTPQLSLMQAILLYLQKPQNQMTSAVADTPFRWSWMGFAHSLASTLGLHMECRNWPIPAGEKRLRRRLWWVTYSELAWRSLLLGFPNPLHDDQWDVAELDHEDFVIDNADGTPCPTIPGEPIMDFMYFGELACIASDVYYAFYTIKATRRLANNFPMSLAAARPLRTRLIEWYAALPEHCKIQHEPAVNEDPCESLSRLSPAYLRLSYLTLELFIYRALLRPIGSVVCPPEGGPELNLGLPQLDGQAMEAAVRGAENCARRILSFTASLRSLDFNSFWFSWSRTCFATVSNFVVLLFVQAPSQEHAREAKRLIAAWRSVLSAHSHTFHQMNLGMLRLNVMHWVGFRELTRTSVWAEGELES